MALHEVKPYHMNGGGAVPTNCAACGEPFRLAGSHLEAWRGTRGLLFCSEFCSDGFEEAVSGNTRKTS